MCMCIYIYIYTYINEAWTETLPQRRAGPLQVSRVTDSKWGSCAYGIAHGRQSRGGRLRGCPRSRVSRMISAGNQKRPFVGVSQGTVLGFGDGFGAIVRGTVAKS